MCTTKTAKMAISKTGNGEQGTGNGKRGMSKIGNL